MLLLHLVTLLAITLMVLAGLWQLDVYTAGQDRDEPPPFAPAVALSEVLGPDDALSADAARTVVVQGSYADAGEQFLVSGRQQAGRNGYWVVSPLLVADVSAAEGRPSALLVVRGWQPTATPPTVPVGDVRVTGVLAPGEQESTAVGPGRVIAAIRIPVLIAEVPFDLFSGYLLRTSESPPPLDGLVRVVPAAADVSWTAGLRNLAYALQWWLFAGFAGFMWWRICLDEVARSRALPGASPAPVA